ncbi:MAG: pseudouridine synthase, partial [Gammaproteobacteria bacterium]
MARSLLFNKPFRVLSQFSPEGDKRTLADYIDLPGVY